MSRYMIAVCHWRESDGVLFQELTQVLSVQGVDLEETLRRINGGDEEPSSIDVWEVDPVQRTLFGEVA